MNKGKTYVKNSPVLINASSILYEGGGKTLDKLFDLVYPVGSVYMSTNSTSPETLFGGSWTKIQGRFLWATGDTPMVTGGSRTTDGTALTINQIPSHYHTLHGNSNVYSSAGSGYWHYQSAIEGYASGSWKDLYYNSFGTNETGGGEVHTHTYMPPYFEVYMWYRTA